MVRSTRSARNRPRWPGPSTSAAATLIAVLIGVSLPFLYAGFVEFFYQMMDFTPLTFRLAVAAVLFSTALGPRLPGRAVLLIARAARRPLTGPVKGRRIEEITGSEPVSGKGVRTLLCAAPFGAFRQKVPDPFSAAKLSL